MLIDTTPRKKHIKFISYTGKRPCLCQGILTLEIDGKIVTFGDKYDMKERKPLCDFSSFWESGGSCGEYGITQNEWKIDIYYNPEEYKEYVEEIDKVFNENVEYGCCGGCY